MSQPRYESKAVDASPLGQPLHYTFANVTAPNRFLKGAMTERISSWHPTDFPKRGIPSKELINMYKHFGEGGIGNILTGNIMLDYDQLEAPGNMIIPLSAEFSGPRFEAFKELATAAKAQGSLIVGQISHPGRQVQDKIQKDPVSASDVQLEGVVFGQTFAKPHAATQEEIDVIVNTFAHSAEFLDRAGYSGIELHGAHGTFPCILLKSRNLCTPS
jgi:2,4-dienoyl-CoA reductase-like NADH-dependent reductase (Old Yellow Enzyme family)